MAAALKGKKAHADSGLIHCGWNRDGCNVSGKAAYLERAGVCSWLHHHDTLLPVVLPAREVRSPCRASAADVFSAAALAFQADLVLTGLVFAVDLSKQNPGDKTKSGMHMAG